MSDQSSDTPPGATAVDAATGEEATEASGRAEIVVIAGMSGAGRSQAGNHLEDLDWFVVDNLPPSLIPKVAELAGTDGSRTPRLALAIGTGGDPADLTEAIDELRSTDARVRVLFLDAADDVLIRRYESTKRRHPHGASVPLSTAIAIERELARPVREAADLVIDTSQLTIYQLKERIGDLFADTAGTDPMSTRVISFGYKHGLPNDVDLVFDCRFLPNPYWDPALRDLTGRDIEVRRFLDDAPDMASFLSRIRDLLEFLVPAYRREGKVYLTIAFGCTGGRHRSVAVAEATCVALAAMGVHASATHRDIDK